MVDVQTISVVIAAASVAAFVANSIIISRREEKRSQQNLETRQAQLFMGIYQSFYSKDFAEVEPYLDEIEIKKSGDYTKVMKDRAIYRAFGTFASFYEGVGVIVRENLVDIRLVSQLMSGNVLWFWDKFGPGIVECRRDFNWPRMGVEIEYLNNRIVEYGREHPELGIASPATH